MFWITVINKCLKLIMARPIAGLNIHFSTKTEESSNQQLIVTQVTTNSVINTWNFWIPFKQDHILGFICKRKSCLARSNVCTDKSFTSPQASLSYDYSDPANLAWQMILSCLQGWQRARSEGFDKNFCRRNYLSQATLEMMAGMR